MSTESLNEQPKICQGKQKLRAICPKGKMEFKFLSSSACHYKIDAKIKRTIFNLKSFKILKKTERSVQILGLNAVT